ncbi:MAG: metallophosphoesterase family protein [Actinomycetes bacterium]
MPPRPRRRALLAALAVVVVLAVAGAAAFFLVGRDTLTAQGTDEPAAPGDTGDEVTLVAVGDIACDANQPVTEDECVHARTANATRELDPDAVLLLGDIQYEDGSPQEFLDKGGYTGSWDAFHDKAFPVTGNHEWNTPTARGYRETFQDRTGGRFWYSYDLGDWHVIALESECREVGGCDVGDDQHEWLVEDLRRNDGKPTLVYWHRARYSSGKHGPTQRVRPLWETTVADPDVQLVVTAHDHDYERFGPLDAQGRPDPDGVPSFVVGTGGASLRCDRTDEEVPASEVFDCETFGVLHLTLRDDGYDWEFVPAVGDLTDEGSSGLRGR